MPVIATDVWQAQPQNQLMTLAKNAVHLWLIDLRYPAYSVEQLADVLSPAERQRAKSFYTPALQNRFISRRGCLRFLLSRYTGLSPDELHFSYGDQGKPFIDNASASGLSFNFSHSSDFALLGITSDNPIGVDIEAKQPISDMLLVARHHFSAAEQSVLFKLSHSQQLTAFYACWSRKEAVIKADGRGLGIPLDSFDVTLAPDEPPMIQRADDAVHGGQRWQLYNLPLGTRYMGALATAYPVDAIRYWLCSDNPSQTLATLGEDAT